MTVNRGNGRCSCQEEMVSGEHETLTFVAFRCVRRQTRPKTASKLAAIRTECNGKKLDALYSAIFV